MRPGTESAHQPQGVPETPNEDQRADAATQALRYISDFNNFDVIRSQVFEHILVEGAGGVELGLEDDGKGGADVIFTTVPWDRIWYDPHIRGPTTSPMRVTAAWSSGWIATSWRTCIRTPPTS